MAIALFKHNLVAYTVALQMLQVTEKAAVIHPTETGKSFIAFKLCEDQPEKIICWRSPSSYIFKTQLENLRKAGGNNLENIHFFTYARLMNMTPNEIAAIQLDYIILDKFHRCGAEVWGQGVQSLLTSFPDTPVLGMVWQPEDPWNAKFRLVQQYYETHGHTNMPTDYVVEGVWLRRWLSEQKARLNGKPTGRSKTAKALTPEQIQQLSTVGIRPQKAALEIA